MCSSTVAVASSVPSGLPSSSAVGPSSIPPLRLHDDTVSEDSQRAMDLFREQWDATTRIAASRLGDLESVLIDLTATSATVNERNSTVARLCSKKSQLGIEINRLTSKIVSFQALCYNLDVSFQRLADSDAETDHLRKVVTSVCDLLDGGLGGFDGQS